MSEELRPAVEVFRNAVDATGAFIRFKHKSEQAAAAVIRDYGDKRYQQAIADVVEWLGVQQHGRTSDNYPGYYARQIEQRFGKDA